MLISTGLMPRGRQGDPECLAALAETAEEAGLTRIWLGDHIVYPVEYSKNYPTNNGVLPYNPASPQLDVISAMAWLLAHTRRVGVGTVVMVIGLRQPVLLAKQLSSLDTLSRGGRVILGVGSGWMREEFESLGVPFANRGRRTDEYIQALRELWTADTPGFSGEFVSFPPLYCNPKPVAGTVPIWIGGVTEAAMARVVRHGDGWLPANASPEKLARIIPGLRERFAAAGRDPSTLGIATTVTVHDYDAITRTAKALREAGLTEVIVPIQGKTPEEIAAFVRRIPDLVD